MVSKFIVRNKIFRKKLTRSITLAEWSAKGKYKILDDITQLIIIIASIMEHLPILRCSPFLDFLTRLIIA